MKIEATYQHSYIADSHPWTKWLLFHQKRNSCIKISIDVFLHVHVTKLNMYNSPCLIYNKKDHKRLMLFKLISVSKWKRNFFRSTKPVVDWVSYSCMTIVMNNKHNNMYATRHDCQWNERCNEHKKMKNEEKPILAMIKLLY